MSRQLHSATATRVTERGLSNTPRTGNPRRDATVPSRNRKTATSGNEDVKEIEEDEMSTNTAKAGKECRKAQRNSP